MAQVAAPSAGAPSPAVPTGAAAPAAVPSIPLEALLPPSVLRNLSDRSFEKRKAGAQEIERILRRVRECVRDGGGREGGGREGGVREGGREGGRAEGGGAAGSGGTAAAPALQGPALAAAIAAIASAPPGAAPALSAASASVAIRRILSGLASEFALHVSVNTRKGGLIALASAAIGLGPATGEHLDLLVPAILRSFSDQDPRVRYYACESLFNVAKVSRVDMLRYFNDVFVGVAKLVADSDNEVKNGANLLDRLLKEIVMESETVDVERFVPLLRAHMGVVNPYVRQLLVSWVTALDSVPGIEMLDYMSELLEGLFDMLSDGNREIRQQAYSALTEFLDQIGKVPPVDFANRVAFKPMVEILIGQTRREKDKFNRVTAVEWLAQFISLGHSKLAPVYDRLAAALLRCLSDSEAEIVSEAAKANLELMHLVRSTPVRDCEEVLPVIIRTVTAEARSTDRATRSAALRWLAMLLAMSPEKVLEAVEDVLAVLLSNLADTDDSEVLRLDLEVLARLSVYDLNLLRSRVLVDLVRLFAENRPLLEAKGSFILRRLCLLLDARIIYVSMARILLNQSNREFASLLVELLNLILLTAVELTELRDLLRGCGAKAAEIHAIAQLDGPEDPTDGPTTFLVLYRTWCHNPVATFALCLLAQAYELGARIVTRFAETTISVGVLMQVDKLVQLLETPIFLTTRLHLTQPERPDHSALLRSLYGLLMLLPQGTAYNTLRDRLTSVTSLHIALARDGGGATFSTTADAVKVTSLPLDSVFAFFTDSQRRQREALTADLKSRSVLARYQTLQADRALMSADAAVDGRAGASVATTRGVPSRGGAVADPLDADSPAAVDAAAALPGHSAHAIRDLALGKQLPGSKPPGQRLAPAAPPTIARGITPVSAPPVPSLAPTSVSDGIAPAPEEEGLLAFAATPGPADE